jgi:hypothetical protein
LLLDSRKSATSAECLEEHRDLIKIATDDLEARLHNIDEKLETLAHTLTEFDLDSGVGPEELGVETMQEYTNHLNLTATKLERHIKHLRDLLVDGLSIENAEESDADLARLLEELNTTRQCMNICNTASLHLKEKISVTENFGTGDAVQFFVSTDGKILHGRNRQVGWRSRQIGGHLSDATMLKLSRDFSKIEFRTTKSDSQSLRGNTSSAPVDEMENRFTERYGRGLKLQSETTTDTSNVSV